MVFTPVLIGKLIVGKNDANTTRAQRLGQTSGVVGAAKACVRIRHVECQIGNDQGVSAIPHELTIVNLARSDWVRGQRSRV